MPEVTRQLIDISVLLSNDGTVVDTWLPSIESKFDQWLPQTVIYTSGRPAMAIDTVLAALPTDEGESRSVVATEPFSRNRLASWNIWHHGETFQLAIKGAPETILAASRLTEGESEAAILAFQRLSKHGVQVLAIAHGRFEQHPDEAQIFAPQTLHFDGLVAIRYRPQAQARSQLRALDKAHRTPILVSAESREMTARLANDFAITSTREQTFDSAMLDELPSRNFTPEIIAARAFSRLTPARLERIVTTLSHHGQIKMANDVRKRIEIFAAGSQL